VYVDCVSLFPDMFGALTGQGVVSRALEQGRWSLRVWNPRDFAFDAYRTIDDRPYGGGPGMVMQPEPLARTLAAAKAAWASRAATEGRAGQASRVIYLSPQGRRLDDARVRELATLDRMVLLCGRYEGIDERLLEQAVDEEISLGDYVISGGELAAMVLVDAVVRQLPGVLGDERSVVQDSFRAGLLDCPHYTRPESYEGVPVPAVLLSGNHALIERWRLKQSLGRTWLRRPELLAERGMDARETALLEEFKAELAAGSTGKR
jgi:tRNA (guanine37-N1)-methyltransferase